MSSLQPFLYGSQEVRTVNIDGEPWFIASDVCRILDLSNPSVVVGRLDSDERAKFNLGRQGHASIVNESGLYSLILGSRKEEAREFQRWIKREVLPQIRKTGSYGTPALTGPALMAAALIEAQATMEAQQAQVRELEPRAQAWDSFLGSTGDYSVNEAAKVLSRDKNIHIGEGRLRAQLEEWRWIYRHSGKPRAMQTQIDTGRLTEKASFYYHPETGEKVAKTPQVRITPKGLDAIAKRMHEVAA